jgi:hypothetical protein
MNFTLGDLQGKRLKDLVAGNPPSNPLKPAA